MSDEFDEQPIEEGERMRTVPAVRCRECGEVTWTVSIEDGLHRRTGTHHKECSRPLGRLDVLEQLTPAVRRSPIGQRLQRPMSNAALAELIEELRNAGLLR